MVSRVAAKMVLSPAMVPTIAGCAASSTACARAFAYPEGVVTTTSAPAGSIVTAYLRMAPARERRRSPSVVPGGAYTRRPLGARTFTSPSSAMSRETVVWTTSNPLSWSAAATSAGAESARSRTSAGIALCRPRRFIVCEKLAQYAVEDGERLVDFAGGHRQRGREPDHAVPRAQDQKPVLACHLDDV